MKYMCALGFIFLFLKTAEASSVCSSLSGKDIFGSDLSHAKAKTVGECCALCWAHPLCRSYAWDAWDGGVCYLKNATGPVIEKCDVNIGFKDKRLKCGPNKEYLACGTSCPIGCTNIRRRPAYCIQKCVPGCFCRAGYVFQDHQNWRTSPCVHEKSCSSKICQLQHGKDIRGGDIASAKARSPSGCCSHCNANPRCKAYAWNDHRGGTCWLKRTNAPIIDKCGVSIGFRLGAEYRTTPKHAPKSTPRYSYKTTPRSIPTITSRRITTKPPFTPAPTIPPTQPDSGGKCGPKKRYLECGPICRLGCDNVNWYERVAQLGVQTGCLASCVSGCFCKPGLIFKNSKDWTESDCTPAELCAPPLQNPNPVCVLPQVSGRCKAAFQMWFYDQETVTCTKYIWGGCGGNPNNRFESKQLCENACLPK